MPGKGKGKVSLCVGHEAVDVQAFALTASALDGSEQLASPHIAFFFSGTLCAHCTRGWTGPTAGLWEKELSVPKEIESRFSILRAHNAVTALT